jgi:GT2 family glycosyltransferase
LTVSTESGTASPALTVTAVVINFNGGERVLKALASLLHQGPSLSGIVVVDNRSDDGSPQRIRERFPGVRLIELHENVGLSTARNIALRNLRSTLALLVDHDIYLEAGSLDRMMAAYAEYRPAIVCPRIRLVPERDVVQTDGAYLHFLGTLGLRNAYSRAAEVPARPGYVGAAIGACLLLDRERVLAAGAFDELYFFYFEDLEFSMRMRLRGERIWCEARAEVYHNARQNVTVLPGSGPLSERRVLTMRNRLLTIFIHYRLRTICLSPVLALYELASLVESARKGWLRSWLGAWSWQIRNRAVIAERRQRARRHRVLRDQDVLSGGVPPLAPGLVESRMDRILLALFSTVINGYWALVRRWIG